MSVDFLDCAVLGYELACADFSDSLDTWDIIGRVSAYGQDLNDLLRSGDVVFLADLLYVNDLVILT